MSDYDCYVFSGTFTQMDGLDLVTKGLIDPNLTLLNDKGEPKYIYEMYKKLLDRENVKPKDKVHIFGYVTRDSTGRNSNAVLISMMEAIALRLGLRFEEMYIGDGWAIYQYEVI